MIIQNATFIKLPKELLDSFAGRQLRSTELAILIRIIYRYNGSNNGRIAASKRDLMKEVKSGDRLTLASLNNLVSYGFLKVVRTYKKDPLNRLANEYALTWLKNDVTGQEPSNDWREFNECDLKVLTEMNSSKRSKGRQS